jgi:hypothetical protein
MAVLLRRFAEVRGSAVDVTPCSDVLVYVNSFRSVFTRRNVRHDLGFWQTTLFVNWKVKT